MSFDDNSELLCPFTKLEFFTALNQMHVDKSPGPVGFNPVFYKKSWEICGDDIF